MKIETVHSEIFEKQNKRRHNSMKSYISQGFLNIDLTTTLNKQLCWTWHTNSVTVIRIPKSLPTTRTNILLPTSYLEKKLITFNFHWFCSSFSDLIMINDLIMMGPSIFVPGSSTFRVILSELFFYEWFKERSWFRLC